MTDQPDRFEIGESLLTSADNSCESFNKLPGIESGAIGVAGNREQPGPWQIGVLELWGGSLCSTCAPPIIT